MREGKSGQYRAPHPDNFGTFVKELTERDSATENNRQSLSPLGDLGAGKGEKVR